MNTRRLQVLSFPLSKASVLICKCDIDDDIFKSGFELQRLLLVVSASKELVYGVCLDEFFMKYLTTEKSRFDLLKPDMSLHASMVFRDTNLLLKCARRVAHSSTKQDNTAVLLVCTKDTYPGVGILLGLSLQHLYEVSLDDIHRYVGIKMLDDTMPNDLKDQMVRLFNEQEGMKKDRTPYIHNELEVPEEYNAKNEKSILEAAHEHPPTNKASGLISSKRTKSENEFLKVSYAKDEEETPVFVDDGTLCINNKIEKGYNSDCDGGSVYSVERRSLRRPPSSYVKMNDSVSIDDIPTTEDGIAATAPQYVMRTRKQGSLSLPKHASSMSDADVPPDIQTGDQTTKYLETDMGRRGSHFSIAGSDGSPYHKQASKMLDSIAIYAFEGTGTENSDPSTYNVTTGSLPSLLRRKSRTSSMSDNKRQSLRVMTVVNADIATDGGDLTTSNSASLNVLQKLNSSSSSLGSVGATSNNLRPTTSIRIPQLGGGRSLSQTKLK